MRVRNTLQIACATLMLLSAQATAQNFPSRPVTIVVPFTPGGGNDIVGRYLADELSKLWGTSVTVENRPGAGGSIGATAVARSEPNGLTLLFMSSTYTTNAATQTNLTFDPVHDLKLVATVGLTDMVVTVGMHVKATTIKELAAESKTRDMLWGSAGAGGSIDFATIMLLDAAGMSMTRVPYKGGSGAIVDMLGGRIDLYVGTASAVLPMIKDGRIRALASTGSERIGALPNVPTVREQSLKDAEMELWWGVFVPSKTPDAVIRDLNETIRRVMSTPKTAEFLKKQDARVKDITIEEGAELIKSEIAKWKALAAKHNIVAE